MPKVGSRAVRQFASAEIRQHRAIHDSATCGSLSPLTTRAGAYWHPDKVYRWNRLCRKVRWNQIFRIWLPMLIAAHQGRNSVVKMRLLA